MNNGRTTVESRLSTIENAIVQINNGLGEDYIAKSFFMGETKTAYPVSEPATNLATAIALVNELRDALIKNGMVVYIQPPS